MFAPRKILVPTDFSEHSDSALAQAVDIARQYKSTIYLLHVLGVVRQCVADYCMSPELLEDVRKEAMRFAREMIRAQIEKIGTPSDIEIIPDIREGTPPHEEILKAQKERDIDLIVIASHGKTGVLHHLMGSVTDKVTRSAECPVYLVRSPQPT